MSSTARAENLADLIRFGEHPDRIATLLSVIEGTTLTAAALTRWALRHHLNRIAAYMGREGVTA